MMDATAPIMSKTIAKLITRLFPFYLVVLGLMCPSVAPSQLVVNVAPTKTVGQKVIVPLAIRNDLAEPVESARAAVLLFDSEGKMLGQASRWIIGGTKTNAPLAPGATNVFYFVITTAKPLPTTNLTTKVNLNRIVLGGGKLANPAQAASIQIRR
jgi:hypothetical protein